MNNNLLIRETMLMPALHWRMVDTCAAGFSIGTAAWIVPGVLGATSVTLGVIMSVVLTAWMHTKLRRLRREEAR